MAPGSVPTTAAPAPATLPQIELARRGFRGPVYQTQGVADNDFLRVGGKELDGGHMTVAPGLVPEQLPDANPIKKVALDDVQKYEASTAPARARSSVPRPGTRCRSRSRRRARR